MGTAAGEARSFLALGLHPCPGFGVAGLRRKDKAETQGNCKKSQIGNLAVKAAARVWSVFSEGLGEGEASRLGAVVRANWTSAAGGREPLSQVWGANRLFALQPVNDAAFQGATCGGARLEAPGQALGLGRTGRLPPCQAHGALLGRRWGGFGRRTAWASPEPRTAPSSGGARARPRAPGRNPASSGARRPVPGVGASRPPAEGGERGAGASGFLPEPPAGGPCDAAGRGRRGASGSRQARRRAAPPRRSPGARAPPRPPAGRWQLRESRPGSGRPGRGAAPRWAGGCGATAAGECSRGLCARVAPQPGGDSAAASRGARSPSSSRWSRGRAARRAGEGAVRARRREGGRPSRSPGTATSARGCAAWRGGSCGAHRGGGGRRSGDPGWARGSTLPPRRSCGEKGEPAELRSPLPVGASAPG